MLKAAVVGASGYAGHELASILLRHPSIELTAVYVSAASQDKDRYLNSLYGDLYGRSNLILQGLSIENITEAAQQVDMVFLCTDHKTAHDEAPLFLQEGCCVFDLSGAFRVPDPDFYERYYGFTHRYPELLHEAVYALCERCYLAELQKARLFSMPGCYPTASGLAVQPLYEAGLLDESFPPVINAVSGVSGAGRKASLFQPSFRQLQAWHPGHHYLQAAPGL